MHTFVLTCISLQHVDFTTSTRVAETLVRHRAAVGSLNYVGDVLIADVRAVNLAGDASVV